MCHTSNMPTVEFARVVRMIRQERKVQSRPRIFTSPRASRGPCCTQMVAVATSMDSESSYSTCQLGYLLGEETSSGGSNSTVCDVVSSAFCCSGSGAVAVDADEELGCATNEAAQELWSCAFEFYECSVEDATCTGDGAAGVNSAPGRLLPGGGGYSAFGVFALSCWVAFVLGLVAGEI